MRQILPLATAERRSLYGAIARSVITAPAKCTGRGHELYPSIARCIRPLSIYYGSLIYLTRKKNIFSSTPVHCCEKDWCYQSQSTCESHCKGPDHWQDVNADCGRRRQSPINIVTKKTLPDERLTPFKFTGYEHAFKPTLKNNGHSVQVAIKHEATVQGGGLDGVYKAVQFHLHWGKEGGPGSEHTIDGEQYPMELHIVHMSEKYGSLGDALKDPSGVAVLGFFYELSTAANRNYEPFISTLERVSNNNQEAEYPRATSLYQLILSNANLTSYYRYEGSLTTPGCTEAVIWTVFEHAIPLSKTQLSAFSKLKFPDGKSMADTFRPVQPLHGRRVYRSGGATVLSSATLLVSAIAMALHLSHPN